MPQNDLTDVWEYGYQYMLKPHPTQDLLIEMVVGSLEKNIIIEKEKL